MKSPELGEQPSIPEPEGDSEKEVFAFLGFAAFLAQELEAELINVAVALRAEEGPELSDQAIEQLFDTHEKRTLGTLLVGVRSRLTLSAGAETAIARAADERNRLIHRFFREHASHFLTPTGRGKMIEDLRSMARSFLEADTFLTDLSNELWALRGVTKAMREMIVQQQMAGADASDQAV